VRATSERAQMRMLAHHVDIAFPKKLCPLVFIYRSPTVKSVFCLQPMIFIVDTRALKWDGEESAIAACTQPHRKEVPWM
jgi:hypothetical protein